MLTTQIRSEAQNQNQAKHAIAVIDLYVTLCDVMCCYRLLTLAHAC